MDVGKTYQYYLNTFLLQDYVNVFNMFKPSMKMETTGRKIVLSATTDSHLLVLPIHITLGNWLHRYDMSFIGQEGSFYKYEFIPKSHPVLALPELAYADALGLEVIMF